MDRDELEEDRAAFIAGEIGGAVVELIIDGVVISRDAIVDSLEAKRRGSGKRHSQRCIAGCGCYGEERAIKNPARWPGWIHKLNY